MKNKVSACLVVHNEEKKIKKCLENIKNVVDEIIVVHDGECQDKTLNICRGYTDKIYVREHIGEAESHRPFSFQQATGGWILQIDADEFLSQELKMAIKDLVRKDNVDAYEFLWPLWDGKKYITEKWPYKRCLYRKEKISFLGIPHFVVQVNGEVKKSDLILRHCPTYNAFTWQSFKMKDKKRARIQAKTYLKNFREISKFNYNGSDWPLKIKLRIRFSIVFMPMDFLVILLRNLLSGGYKEGIIGYKIALMHGAYRAIVDYYIFKYQ